MSFSFRRRVWGLDSNSVQGRLDRILLVAASCFLGLWGCREVLPYHSVDSDSNKTEMPDTAEGSIMPNGQGFLNRNDLAFNLQGAWYWFDDGATGSRIQKVTATIVDADISESDIADSEAETDTSQNERVWFDELDGETLDFRSELPVDKICLNGNVGEYIAIGFEVCSTQSNAPPYEFPATLGICSELGTEDGLLRFRGIRFDLDLSEYQFSKVDVEFKVWAPADFDDTQPRCTAARTADAATNAYRDCGYAVLSDTKTRFWANWENAESVNPKFGSFNLSMLQAIHIKVYPQVPDKGDFSFCLSNAKAFGYSDSATSMNSVESSDTFESTCAKWGERAPLSDDAPQWNALNLRWTDVPAPVSDTATESADGFQIMTTEVTVGQYRLCEDNGQCTAIEHNWESCNASPAGERSEHKDTEWEQKAVNCVNWCQARDFCEWVGGRLPTEAEWTGAAQQFGKRNSDCTEIVMNDPDYGGVGCGDRMPATVCSIKMDTAASADIVCDMLGNLWEWVSNENDASSGSSDRFGAWADGYKELMGGSLNSIRSNSLAANSITIEHPTVLHSPTRVGFRCVKNMDAYK